MYVSSDEFIMTIENDGECYKQFIEACKKRFFGGEFHVGGIIMLTRLQLRKLNDGDTVDYEVGTMRDARKYLENRYFSHFLTEIASEYIKNAQNQLEMYEKSCQIV